MTHPAARPLAVLLTAAALVGCASSGPGPSASAGVASRAASPAAPATEPSVPAAAPSAGTTPSPADEPDAGAPTTASGGAGARPGLGGVPDPAALTVPSAPRTTPNLGDADYVQPVTTLGALPDSPVLSGSGFAGAKVDLIQRAFGIERTIQQLDSETIAAVRDFQDRNGIEVTGEVGRETWSALFPDISWGIDRYRTRPALPLDAPAEARVEQMIRYIRTEALGARYVWGAAGPKEYGYDCSGLLLQAMYSAGIDPQPINVVDHQRPNYPTARKLYLHEGFKHVPLDEVKRGDLVFFGPTDNPDRITHVAMFLGNGYVLEAIPTRGVSQDRYYESYRSGSYAIHADAVRVVG